MSSSAEESTSPVVKKDKKPEKPTKPYKPSAWQTHLKKAIDENKGKGLKLAEITKLASKTYNKDDQPTKAKVKGEKKAKKTQR